MCRECICRAVLWRTVCCDIKEGLFHPLNGVSSVAVVLLRKMFCGAISECIFMYGMLFSVDCLMLNLCTKIRSHWFCFVLNFILPGRRVISTCENSLCVHSVYVTRCIALRRTLVWFEQRICFVQHCTQILFEFETSGSKRQRDYRFALRGGIKI